MFKIDLPEEVEYVIDEIMSAGYEAYLVGGCVRDFIMGVIPKDYDVTTDATPDEVHRVFDNMDVHIINTGIKQGTVTVIRNHVPVEVTTYRTESTYSDNRHPDDVRFSKSLTDDLSRRDFTMNAIAWNSLRGKNAEVVQMTEVDRTVTDDGSFVDLFNGIADIKNNVIRCVGNPRDRFSEDALRIMRALRFASTLDFEIEGETAKAIFDLKDNLNNISRERIQKELEGLICGSAAERILREYANVIAVIIPEIVPMIGLDQCTPYHIYDVWEHSIRVVSGVPGEPVLRLAALFHDIGKPPCFFKDEDGVGHFYGHPEVSAEMAGSIMRRLRFDNETRNKVLTLVRWHDFRPEATEKSVRKALVKVGAELFDEWIAIKRADNLAQAPEITERQEYISEIEEIGHRLIEEEGTMSLKTLNISGKDLMELGVREGPEIGRILNELLADVLEERLTNEKPVLIEAARKAIDIDTEVAGGDTIEIE